jgi:hypothetical protein
MNILELDSYNLDDAVKFNDRLNPRLWDSTEHLKPEVKAQLLLIAEDFREFLGVIDLDLQDITISGSNAAYTYTPNSDIDLHLVVKMPADEVYRELFDSKKFQYNEQHNITIGGYDVELYVQSADQPHISQGIYSVLNDDWIQVPRRVKSVVDDTSTENKFKTVGLQIEKAIASGSLTRMTRMAEKIKKMRQTGLEAHGEFGPENLAFKMLRSQGKIKELYDARNAAKDQELSLRERQQPHSVFTYGFKHEEANPVVEQTVEVDAPSLSDEQILKDFIQFCVAELKIKSMPTVKLRRDPQWSVVNKTFGRYINDAHLLEVAFGQRHIMDVLRTVAHELTHKHQHERETVPGDAGETGSPYENEANARAGILMRDYGRLHPELFDAGETELEEGWKQNVAAGILGATMALGGTPARADTGINVNPVQVQQMQKKADLTQKYVNALVQRAKDDGRPLDTRAMNTIKAQASDMAARQVQAQGSTTQQQQTQQSNFPAQGSERMVSPNYNKFEESASGYIPTKKQAQDPRFSMALTQDIRPGQLGKEANKLKLRTDSQGHPQIANPNGLFEQLMAEYQGLAEDKQQYLWHGSTQKIPVLQPRQAQDTGGALGSNQNAIYATADKNTAIKMGMAERGSDTAMFDQADQLVLFSGRLRRGKNVYLHQLPRYDANGQDMWLPGGNGNEFYTKPEVKEIKPLRVITVPVDGHLDLVRKPTAKDLKLRQKYLHQARLKQRNITEDQQLDEVKMSPSALQKWAKSPEAEGIRAGFEAELIFRDTASGDDDDYEMEPDYDMDERCRSIQQIIDFFQGGDYGGLNARQEARLQEGLDEQYYEWYDEQMLKDFSNEAEDLIRKVMVDEGDWDLDNEIQKQLELLDLTDDEMNDIINAGERAPKFTSSKEQQEYAETNPLYQKYLDAQEEAEGLLDDLIEDEVRKQGANWDAALDDFRDNYQIDDDSGFFDDVGLRWMSDIANNYDLDWPYMTGSGSNGGSREWNEIGDSLHSAVDMPVKVSTGYHQATRREGVWIVEPDSSLQPDDSEDFGLEIVSPPLPLEQALEKLEAVCDWANSDEGNCYTNSSTGLHMGVSVPFKGGDVDYLKLILFLGDEYVLQSFGREANTYTKSAMSKFRENIKGGRADPMGAIKLMQSGLIELAHREIQKGVGDGKYTSAHIQKGYIEFRSAGGDWLAEENADPEKLSSTMLRYARAMSLAANPGEERREYAKKLYKLVAPEGDSELALFSQFAAGELTAEQLKKKWAEKTIGTEKKMNQRWRLYQNVDGRWEPVPGAEWNGYPESEVKMRVWAKYGREALDSGEYQLVNMGEQDWEVYDVKTGATLEIVKGKSKGEVADAVYDKYVDQGIGFQVRPYEDPATATPRAKLAKRIASAPNEQPQMWQVVNRKTGKVYDTVKGTKSGLGSVLRNFEKDQGIPQGDAVLKLAPNQPDSQQSTNERGIPYWEVYEKETGHVVHTFLSDTAADAKVDGANWLESIGAEQPDLFKVRAKMKATTPVAGQVQDVEPDVAQNFNQPRDATELPHNWEFVDRRTGRVVDTMPNATYNQANTWQAAIQRSNPDADISLRSVSSLEENFADGKGPGRPGDSQRHGIPKGATIAQLEKASHAKGRKGQLARWQLNMRRGKAKAK